MNVLDKHSRASIWRARTARCAVAVFIAVVWGAVVQTQFNIAAIESIGAKIPALLRAQMTARDLIGFTPIYAVIVTFGLLCAFPVAALIQRNAPRYETLLYTLAGGVGIAAAIRFVDIATPAPTLIAATRTTTGLLVMAIGGALAGCYFARKRKTMRKE